MAKDTFYFTHDYNARNDLKMAVLREDYGMEGVGIYWCLIEMLYEEGGYISLDDIDDVAKTLRTNTTVVRGVIDSKLFQKNETHFYSNAVLTRLEKRSERSEKARQSVLNRYKTPTNVYERIPSNTIKEKKRKEKNNNKEINKESYGEFKNVLLSKEEHKKLYDKFGEARAGQLIETLSAGIKSKGYKYKDHYAAILNWARRDEKEAVDGKTNSTKTRAVRKPDEFTDPDVYFGRK